MSFLKNKTFQRRTAYIVVGIIAIMLTGFLSQVSSYAPIIIIGLTMALVYEFTDIRDLLDISRSHYVFYSVALLIIASLPMAATPAGPGPGGNLSTEVACNKNQAKKAFEEYTKRNDKITISTTARKIEQCTWNVRSNISGQQSIESAIVSASKGQWMIVQ